MARRPARRPRYSVPVVESQPITPESGLRVTLRQALVVAGVVAAAALAYGTIKWDQAAVSKELVAASKDIAAIRDAQKAITATTAAALKEQEDKRSAVTKEQEERRRQLGESFLASNKEIAAKVGELATAVAVQQSQFRATTDALAKIGDQLNTLVHQMPEKRR